MQLLEINWYKLFYWLTLSDSVKKFFDSASNLFTIFAVISFIFMVVCSVVSAFQISSEQLKNADEEKINPEYRSWRVLRRLAAPVFYVSLFLSIITWIGYIATPTKKDCLIIVAGGAVSTFALGDSSVRALPADFTKFVSLYLKKEISSLSVSDKLDIGLEPTVVESKRETFLDKAAHLTKDELIQALKSDTSILK